jgi:Leishmanolysin
MTTHSSIRAGAPDARRGRRTPALLLGAAVVAVAALACTPNAPTTTTTTTLHTDEPTPPVALAFATVGAIGRSPAVVTFSWAVGDANGDPLTCHIDGDGDGADDVTIDDCQEAGRTRNVAVALPPGATAPATITARLTVEDGTFPAVVRTVTYSLAPGPVESFDVTLRGTESLAPAESAAFTDAADRWEQVITRGIADYSGSLALCQPVGSPIVGTVDDVVIDVAVVAIDGPGEILGQAGPSCVNPSTELPVSGLMRFDSADVAAMLADGNFDDVVLHEMGHVLGFGTLWDLTPYGGSRKLLQGAGGSSPRFSGPRAMAEWSLLDGVANVPVEATGGSGTADAHWRETTFGDELMTGWISESSNPLSAVTIASLGDLGYQVDLDQADAFELPWSSSARRVAPAPRSVDATMLRPPLAFP